MIGGKVLDVTAVLDLTNGRSRYAEALLVVATEVGIPLAVPATALLAAWQTAPPAARPWLNLLADAAPVVVVDLTAASARAAGIRAADSGNLHAHPATAHAVQVATERSWPIVTRDPMAMLALNIEIRTETIP
jgi:hypothetical protein